MSERLSNRLRVVVLLSLGRHRVSDRPCRARRDAQALEMALGLDNADITAVHAGEPGQPALRDYLGMGLASLTVLDIPVEADAIPSLEDHLRDLQPDVVLAGSKGSGGEDSGLLPYILARALDLPVISDVVALQSSGDGVNLLQALSGGRRRALRSRPPLLATVPLAAPPPRAVAYGPARRGQILPIQVRLVIDAVRADWHAGRAQNRLKFPGVNGTEPAEVRRPVVGLSAEEGAAEIYRYLLEQDIVRETQ